MQRSQWPLFVQNLKEPADYCVSFCLEPHYEIINNNSKLKFMKKLFFLKFFILTGFLYLVISCSNEKRQSEETGVSSADTAGKELWAERIESSASLTIPEGWTEEDWKSVTEGIDQEKIFNTVFESVLSGKQQAYDYISDSPITADQVKKMMITTGNRLISGPDSTQVSEEYADTITAKDLSTVKCREKWYFDKEKFALKSEISSIALFTNVYSETGDLKGIKALFYVKLN